MPHQITRATDLRHLLRLTTVRPRRLALRTVKPAQWKKTKDLNQGSHIVKQSLTASSPVLKDYTCFYSIGGAVCFAVQKKLQMRKLRHSMPVSELLSHSCKAVV